MSTLKSRGIYRYALGLMKVSNGMFCTLNFGGFSCTDLPIALVCGMEFRKTCHRIGYSATMTLCMRAMDLVFVPEYYSIKSYYRVGERSLWIET